MIADVWTVIWKEAKEILLQKGSLRGGNFGIFVFVAVFGIFLPLQMGGSWLSSPMALVYWAWVPMFMVNSVIADAFAGERERHTLETLLSSRLSDRAILFGKIGAGVGYGWGLTLVGLLLGLVTVNLAHGQGELRLFPLEIGLGILAISLLVSVLAAVAGVLISLRAATVRQAQQILGVAVMLLLFIPIFGLQALPAEWRARLVQLLAGADVAQIILIAVAVLVLLDAGLLLAALVRFKRAKLILD